jgi:hypothetical protein
MSTHVRALPLITVVGADDAAITQNEYGTDFAITFKDRTPAFEPSGEILAVQLITGANTGGTGVIPVPAGKLIFFDTDPTVAAGDTTLTAVEWATVIAIVDVESTDWHSDTNGAGQYINLDPVTFQNQASLWGVWFHESATGFNSAAGDDETLKMRVYYRSDEN